MDLDYMFVFKFLLLWIPFSVVILIFAPGIKWKLLFPICGAVGIWLALTGKTIGRKH